MVYRQVFLIGRCIDRKTGADGGKIEPFQLYVDPMAVTLSTNGNALTMFAEC